MRDFITALTDISLGFRFSDDSSKVVFAANTIVYSAIQLAVYMGFSEIYLTGCDCNYTSPKKHFNHDTNEKIESKIKLDEIGNLMLASYRADKKIHGHASGKNIQCHPWRQIGDFSQGEFR